jgi:hypothetical protein
MPLTADDFRSLADQFSGLANSIVVFEEKNPQLSDSDFQAIDHMRKVALDQSDKFLIAAIQQTLKDLNAPLARISNATVKMNESLKNLNNIGKAISIASAGIQLGVAILSGQMPAITQAIGNLVDSSSGSGSGSSPGSEISS